jgi:argininosuccinate lyase
VSESDQDPPPTRDKAWGGRFEKPADPKLEQFSASIGVDQRLWRQDIEGSLAHARMLVQQGILTSEEGATLEAGLTRIAREIEAGEFPFDPAAEDLHMNVERRLYQHVGDVAGKLHTGRSRNDQVATDFTLWMRDAIPAVRGALLGLRRVLVERAEREIDVVLPGYTHLQRAQPVRLAHHWLAHFEALRRDDGRLRDAAARLDRSPLGAGALAGTTLPLDRERTARELGFVGPMRNSLDAVAARDGALELCGALAIVAVHLSRLAEELVLWSSSEFGFVEFDDAFATGSSLMPQKKNPDVAELVRGKTGRVVGSLVSLLVTLKGLPLTYNRDMQEDKEPVFDAVDTVRACLDILAASLRTLRVKRDAMERAASDPQLLATDLAEELVRAGVPFREAHHLVGRVVAEARRDGVSLRDLDPERLRELHPALAIDPQRFFSVERSLEARDAPGSPSRKNVERALAEATRANENVAGELAEKGT